eukprot:CAMPEP_0172370252 /NCGR_PEP_ID=MMETSP1060-20121228/36885_1 /TAXON_ID=37318 /ORGANISM="Pseudo-nitzschia pungens, Strain cf. cingulata" /LENGTH=360 /DNA_ID=CAMNT_0013095455 /DNA_START=220 /DNA_END=1302 /DNA_ORIENTATION=-
MATETGGGESVAFPREVCKERRHDNHTAGFIPLIDIGTTTTSADTNAVESTPLSREIAIDLVSALRNSGFALVRSPLLSKDLQSRAIEAASRYLAESSETSDDGNPSKTGNETTKVDVIPHPTDPKVYAMLDSEDQFDLVAPDSKAITEYVRALRSIKTEVLRLIATGLDMNDADFFAKLHDEDNDTLRLITYFPTHSETTGNRCKEHSDYGTITLLSTDSVSGLELFHDGTWLPVPHTDGALVVNVGSLLAGWTKGTLRATLHRVAGPASENSGSDRQVLVEATKQSRTSIAYFVDPNRNVSESLAATTATEGDDDLKDALRGMSVAEYIRWRSGGDGFERSGVSFTPEESKIIATERT